MSRNKHGQQDQQAQQSQQQQEQQEQNSRPLQIERLNSDNHRVVIHANNRGSSEEENAIFAAIADANALADKAETDSEHAAAAMAQTQAHRLLIILKLGILKFFDDVLPDNPTLLAALETIHAAGAPSPTVVRESFWWPGGDILPEGSAQVDVYEYTHPKVPTITHRATEYLLALNPQVVINDLKLKGII